MSCRLPIVFRAIGTPFVLRRLRVCVELSLSPQRRRERKESTESSCQGLHNNIRLLSLPRGTCLALGCAVARNMIARQTFSYASSYRSRCGSRDCRVAPLLAMTGQWRVEEQW